MRGQHQGKNCKTTAEYKESELHQSYKIPMSNHHNSTFNKSKANES